jgi:hypothetical protein
MGNRSTLTKAAQDRVLGEIAGRAKDIEELMSTALGEGDCSSLTMSSVRTIACFIGMLADDLSASKVIGSPTSWAGAKASEGGAA